MSSHNAAIIAMPLKFEQLFQAIAVTYQSSNFHYHCPDPQTPGPVSQGYSHKSKCPLTLHWVYVELGVVYALISW